MIGPQVQKAIYDALTASPAVAGGRVYDSVPTGVSDYVTIGEEQIVGDGNSCGDGWEVFADIHVWSEAVGFPTAKATAATIVDRIAAITSISVGFQVILVELQDQRALRDPDGLTSHIVCSFRFIIDQA